MSVNLAEEIAASAITVQATATDWRAAVRLAGAGLTASGVATEAYTDEMIAAVEEHGPYIVIAPGIALAHSRPSPAVLRTGLSFVSLAEPVAFGHAVNDPVRLVLGFAAVDHDSHIALLSAVAGVLGDRSKVDALLAADSVQSVLDLFQNYAS